MVLLKGYFLELYFEVFGFVLVMFDFFDPTADMHIANVNHLQSDSLDYRLDYVIDFLSCWCVILNCYKLSPPLHVDMN